MYQSILLWASGPARHRLIGFSSNVYRMTDGNILQKMTIYSTKYVNNLKNKKKQSNQLVYYVLTQQQQQPNQTRSFYYLERHPISSINGRREIE